MTNKTGIVMEVNKKKATLMTPSGEFVEVKVKGNLPKIGSTYTGSSVNKIPFYKYAAVAAFLLIFISTGGAAYAYYTPTASITLNDALNIKLNRWNRIIKTLPLNKYGKDLLHLANIKNKNINDGLNTLVKETKDTSNKVSLKVTSSTNKALDLSQFEDSSKKENLNVTINYNKSNSTNSKEDNTVEDNNKDKDAIKRKSNNVNSTINKTNKANKSSNKKMKKNIINPNKNKLKNKNKRNNLNKTLNPNKKDLRRKLKNNSNRNVKSSKPSNNKPKKGLKNIKKNSNNHK